MARSLLYLTCLALCLGTLHVLPDTSAAAIPFLLMMGGASLAFLGLVREILEQRFRMGPWAVIALSLLFHLLLLPTGPHFDDDLYRYTWDGKVLSNGHSPYQHPPNSLDLIDLWRKDQYRIPYDHVPTIYPPATQGVFLAVSTLKPDSFMAMKITFSLINQGVVLLLLLLLSELKRPPTWALIYALNPLVLKEVANSGHMDPWMLFWLLLSILLIKRGHTLKSAVALALSVLSKWVPLLLLMIYWRRLGFGKWLGLFFGTIVLFYLPFLDANLSVLGGLKTYGNYWVFNPGLYDLVEMATASLLNLSAQPLTLLPRVSRMLAGAVVALGALWIAWRMKYTKVHGPLTQAVGLTLGLLLLFSPTVDPWYLLWIAPFVALHPSKPGILFTLLPFFSYAYYISDADPTSVRIVQYGILYIALIHWFLKHGLPLPSGKGTVT